MTDKRFKNGDKVRCLISGKTKELPYDASEEVTVGKVYIVTHTSLDNENLFILDDRGHSTNLKVARFELVEENQMKFKPGDRVRALKTSGCKGFNKGNIYTVKKYSEYGTLMLEKDDNGSITNGWFPEAFELVSSQSELQTLVDQANAGFSALRKLRDWDDNEIEIKHTHASPYRGISGIDMPYGFTPNVRIKPKTKKFRIASWDATIEGETVKIGCQQFVIQDLRNNLNALVHYNFSSSGKLKATKTGILFADSHAITWKEAEQLLKELES